MDVDGVIVAAGVILEEGIGSEAACSRYTETVQRISYTMAFEITTVPMIMLHF